MVERAHLLTLRLVNRFYSLWLGSAFKNFGTGSTIVRPMRINNVHRVEVGERVFFGEHCWVNANAGGESTIIRIGSGCGFAGFCVISGVHDIRIDENVLCARNVYISDHSHKIDECQDVIMGSGLDQIKSVHIGRGAWLGQNVVICPGVSIGEGAVVGANSVVKGDVPPFAISAGAPASVRRFRRR